MKFCIDVNNIIDTINNIEDTGIFCFMNDMNFMNLEHFPKLSIVL